MIDDRSYELMYQNNEHDTMEDNFRADIKYSRQLPEMFMTNDINAQTENVTYSLLGELRDRYKENEVATFTFQELAELGGLYIKRKSGKIDLFSGKKLDKAMALVSLGLKEFAYYRVTETNSDGTPKSWDMFPLFSRISVDGTKRLVHLTVSTMEISPFQIDAKGNKLDKPLRIYDLINSTDWRTVKHLQFSREIHYGFVSKYTKRIYRFLSEFRNFPKGTKMRIDDFDKKILKIWLPKEEAIDSRNAYDYRTNRKKFLDRAMKEIRNLKTSEGKQIVQNLDYIFYKTGKSINAIEFTFKPFKDDLSANNKLSSAIKATTKGQKSEFFEDAQLVLAYLNFLNSIKFEYNSEKFVYQLLPKEGEKIYFDITDNNLIKPILTLLENGVPVEELMQVEEMKAFEWRDNIELLSNMKPSVLFGSKYSEYRAYLNHFRSQYQIICDKDKVADFEIPMNGPWNGQ